jgi:hypothetical protein
MCLESSVKLSPGMTESRKMLLGYRYGQSKLKRWRLELRDNAKGIARIGMYSRPFQSTQVITGISRLTEVITGISRLLMQIHLWHVQPMK